MKITKDKLWDLAVIAMILLLVRTFLSYGFGKVTGGQFEGLTKAELNTPIRDLSLFKVGWYLFDHQPFKIFVGLSQIIAALMLLHRKTVIIGALMFVPIIVNIIVIDLTIMDSGMAIAFFFRLSSYLLLLFLILMYHKETTLPMLKLAVSSEKRFKFEKPYWHYLLIPAVALLIEIPTALLAFAFKSIYFYFTHP